MTLIGFGRFGGLSRFVRGGASSLDALWNVGRPARDARWSEFAHVSRHGGGRLALAPAMSGSTTVIDFDQSAEEQRRVIERALPHSGSFALGVPPRKREEERPGLFGSTANNLLFASIAVTLTEIAYAPSAEAQSATDGGELLIGAPGYGSVEIIGSFGDGAGEASHFWFEPDLDTDASHLADLEAFLLDAALDQQIFDIEAPLNAVSVGDDLMVA